jgi:hypothetical protein
MLPLQGSRVRLQDPKSKAGSGPDFLLPGVSIIEDAVDKETDDDLNMRLGGWAGEALRGEHVTMITYGETHCGKTFVLEDAFIKTVCKSGISCISHSLIISHLLARLPLHTYDIGNIP